MRGRRGWRCRRRRRCVNILRPLRIKGDGAVREEVVCVSIVIRIAGAIFLRRPTVKHKTFVFAGVIGEGNLIGMCMLRCHTTLAAITVKCNDRVPMRDELNRNCWSEVGSSHANERRPVIPAYEEIALTEGVWKFYRGFSVGIRNWINGISVTSIKGDVIDREIPLCIEGSTSVVREVVIISIAERCA